MAVCKIDNDLKKPAVLVWSAYMSIRDIFWEEFQTH